MCSCDALNCGVEYFHASTATSPTLGTQTHELSNLVTFVFFDLRFMSFTRLIIVYHFNIYCILKMQTHSHAHMQSGKVL